MRFLLISLILFSFWFLLSGETNPILISSGIISSLFITYLSGDLLISEGKVRKNVHLYIKFLRYIPYLIYEIIIANIDVVYRVLHPKMPIDPVIVKFNSELETDFCIVTYANSITLTPGTVTIDVGKKRDFIVHSLTSKYAESLLTRDMEKKIKEIENV
ncbi:MAG: Na+/H+ antiporter subunit E [Proteobacteria bacterium]|nr:Na+/H+ antiporter subunit E [Pseudomonadota bacterium]